MNFDLMSDFFQEPIRPVQNYYEQGISPKEHQITKKLYENTRGINTPKSYMIVLDSRVINGAQANNFVYNRVQFDLCDPIIIDSPTDIYLEFLHFQNTDVSQSNGTEISSNLEQTSQFYMDIDEFSIRNISNNQFQSSQFFIPNHVYGKTDHPQNDDDTSVKTSFVKLKSNYLCRIEANYIRRLTVTIRAESNNGADGTDETTYGYLSNRDGGPEYDSGVSGDNGNYSTFGSVKIGLFFDKK